LVTGLFFPINDSSISWTRGRYSSDINHAFRYIKYGLGLMAYFVDYPSVVYFMKSTKKKIKMKKKKKKKKKL